MKNFEKLINEAVKMTIENSDFDSFGGVIKTKYGISYSIAFNEDEGTTDIIGITVVGKLPLLALASAKFVTELVKSDYELITYEGDLSDEGDYAYSIRIEEDKKIEFTIEFIELLRNGLSRIIGILRSDILNDDPEGKLGKLESLDFVSKMANIVF